MTVSAVGLAACGDSGTTTQTGTLCTALPPLAMKSTYRIGFAQLYEENGPWRDANTKSIMDEAAKRGYELVYDPGTKPDAAEQVARMQALIAAKVDAIIIAPHDEIVLAPSVVAARRACIPVFIEDRAVDTNVAIPGVDYVSYIGSDFRKEGELTADWLIAKTGGQAKIIELEGTVGSSPGVQRKQGFDTRIAAQSGMSILASQSGDFNETMGYSLTKTLVPAATRPPTSSTRTTTRCRLASSRPSRSWARLPGTDIMVVSIDGTRKGTQYIIDGKIAAITECNPKFGPDRVRHHRGLRPWRAGAAGDQERRPGLRHHQRGRLSARSVLRSACGAADEPLSTLDSEGSHEG